MSTFHVTAVGAIGDRSSCDFAVAWAADARRDCGGDDLFAPVVGSQLGRILPGGNDGDRIVGLEAAQEDERGDGRQQACREDGACLDGDLSKDGYQLNDIKSKSTTDISKRRHKPCFTCKFTSTTYSSEPTKC